jgi:hypothetical protein
MTMMRLKRVIIIFYFSSPRSAAIKEAGGRRQEAGGRRQEAGGRR